MFVAYNPSNRFYRYRFDTGEKKLIGNEVAFVRNVVSQCYNYNENGMSGRLSAYKRTKDWEYIAFHPNDKKREMVRYKNYSGSYSYQWTGTYEPRTFAYMDGYGRMINPYNYLHQLIAMENNPEKYESTGGAKFNWDNKWKKIITNKRRKNL